MTTTPDADADREAIAMVIARSYGLVSGKPNKEEREAAKAILVWLRARGRLVGASSIVVPMIPIDPEADRLASEALKKARAGRVQTPIAPAPAAAPGADEVGKLCRIMREAPRLTAIEHPYIDLADLARAVIAAGYRAAASPAEAGGGINARTITLALLESLSRDLGVCDPEFFEDVYTLRLAAKIVERNTREPAPAQAGEGKAV